MIRRIYLASSWRNAVQPKAVALLREAGHEVYDFRQPTPGSNGFGWEAVDSDYRHWGHYGHIQGLGHPIARRGYSYDKGGLDWADTCVLLLPCGKSAHLEAGYAMGQGKPTLIVLGGPVEPELMYLLAGDPAYHVVAGLDDMVPALETLPHAPETSVPDALAWSVESTAMRLQMEHVCQAVQRMRQAQRDYFAHHRADMLLRAKAQERTVDSVVATTLDKLQGVC